MAAVVDIRAAALERRLAEEDPELGRLAAAIFEAEVARAASPAPAVTSARAEVTPKAKALPPPPPDPAEAYARQDVQLAGLAIIAREHPEKGSRRSWLAALDELGRHLRPGASPAEQRDAALADERGKAFVEARQSCLT
jgi:hypothetical protein